MFGEQFWQQLVLTLVAFFLGGVALWTWQKRYWDYQLLRQRDDWMKRQCYSRKDSQRAAMEELLVEMNQALESFVAAAWLAASAIQRRSDCVEAGGNDEGIEKWNEEVDRSVQQFNEAEQTWLVQSRVIIGKIRLYFDDGAADYDERWNDVIEFSAGSCSLLNNQDLPGLSSLIIDLRKKKDELLKEMRKEIDRFVSEELTAKKTAQELRGCR